MSNSISLMEIDEHLIELFTNELFNSKDARVTEKDFDNKEIHVKCTTEGWQDEDGEFSVKDEIIYRVPNGIDNSISADFSINSSDVIDYYKFLLKNNVNPIVDLLD